jgi:hypothetical protein
MDELYPCNRTSISYTHDGGGESYCVRLTSQVCTQKQVTHISLPRMFSRIKELQENIRAYYTSQILLF